jgi:hypothetical protein
MRIFMPVVSAGDAIEQWLLAKLRAAAIIDQVGGGTVATTQVTRNRRIRHMHAPCIRASRKAAAAARRHV